MSGRCAPRRASSALRRTGRPLTRHAPRPASDEVTSLRFGWAQDKAWGQLLDDCIERLKEQGGWLVLAMADAKGPVA